MNVKRSSRWISFFLAATMAVSSLGTPAVFAAEGAEVPQSAPVVKTEQLLPELPEKDEPAVTEVPDAEPVTTEVPNKEPVTTETPVPETNAPAAQVEGLKVTAVSGSKASPKPAAKWHPNAIWTNGFEELETGSGVEANAKKYWKNGAVPKDWKGCWQAAAPAGGKSVYFELTDAEKAEGSKGVHIHSDDINARIDMTALFDKNKDSNALQLDLSKNYVLSFWIRTENVVGLPNKGFLIRFQTGKNVSEKPVAPRYFTGTTPWVEVQMEIDNTLINEQRADFKIEMFADNMTGDVWIDQMQLIQVGGEPITPPEPPKPAENVIWSNSLDESTPATGALAKFWKNGKAPAGVYSSYMGPAAKDGELTLELDTTVKKEGTSSVHVVSTNNALRPQPVMYRMENVDFTKNYMLRAWVKSKDVACDKSWKGAHLRVQIPKRSPQVVEGEHMFDSIHLWQGSQDWTLLEIPLVDLVKRSGKEVGSFAIEWCCDFFKGEAWIDGIELVELAATELPYELKLDKTSAGMKVGETLQLKAEGAPNDKKITWTTSDEKVATVNETGLVTAVGGGAATITASTDEEHSASCVVAIDSPEMAKAYAEMRARWVERLTGNSYWKGEATSADQKAVVEQIDLDAKEALDLFVANSETQLYTDLDLKLKEGSTSTSAKDSDDLRHAITYTYRMALAWATKGSAYYQDAAVLEKVLYAMNWAYDHFYNEKLDNQARYGNWYHWWISMPQQLAGTVILVHDQVPAELLAKEAKTLEHFNEDPSYVYKVLGAKGKMEMLSGNLADTSLASVLRGIACDDQIAVVNGTKYFNKLAGVVTSGEGIYPDGSFIQHTDKAYTGGYGATLLNGVERLVYLTNGTDWAVSAEQLNGVYSWIWNGIRPLYAEGAMFDMVSGRGITRNASTDYNTGRGLLAAVCLMADNAPEAMKAPLKSFVKGQLEVAVKNYGDSYIAKMSAAATNAARALMADASVKAEANKGYAHVFGSMDKAVAHSDKFSLGISYASARTSRLEFGNEENRKGWHHSDGVTFIYGGDPMQFSDGYWPTVDSHRLPGITTDHSIFPLSAWATYKGNANFNGGSAVGPYASVAMNFRNYSTATNPSLVARKTWFVFDDEVVALGSGINGLKKGMTTETIVDNKKINGDNALIVDGKTTAPNLGDKASFEDAKWAWMDGNTDRDAIGYYFPSGSKLNVLREQRSGRWNDINSSALGGPADGEVITRNYMSLAIPHGEYMNNYLSSYRGEFYDYVLLPGKTAEEVKSYSENPDIEVLVNNTFAQGARDNKAGVTGIIFWGDSKIPLRIHNVESLKGSYTLVENADGTTTIGMADPLQNSDSITLRLYGTDVKLVSADANVTVKTDKYGAVLTANTKGAQGATFTATLKVGKLPEAQLAEMAKIRNEQADGITGNSMPDKNDTEYKAVMAGYAEDAKEAMDVYVAPPAGKDNRVSPFSDVDLTLDWQHKGNNNTHGSTNYTTVANHLKDMAQAYASEGCTGYYHNPELKAAIIDVLQFILDNYPDAKNFPDRVFANWWDWAIGVPKALTTVGIVLYNDLPAEMIDGIYDYLLLMVPSDTHFWMRSGSGRGYLAGATAANKAELAMLIAQNGLLGDDPVGMMKASDSQVNTLKYVTAGEGFYPDGSYKQHGNFAYTGSYGAEMLRGVTKIASLTNGTSWASKDANTDIVYEWILKAFRPIYAYGGVFDMLQGRSISRFGRYDIGTGRYIMDAILTLSINAPEKYRDELLSFIKTQVAFGVKYDAPLYFGKLRFSSLIQAKKLLSDPTIPLDDEVYSTVFGYMDKAVAHSSKYVLGISMYSRRNGAVECGNGENPHGWYTSDGALFLYAGDQSQYASDGYWASIDPLRLPGIITNHVTKPLGSFSNKVSDRDWVGGSISGVNEIASFGMDFHSNYSNLEAKKSWFTLGNQIVALGAGITTTEGDFVETIVENRKLNGNNQFVVNGTVEIPNLGDKKTADKTEWAWLEGNVGSDSTGFYFPGSTGLELLREEHTGKWSDINGKHPEEPDNTVTNKFLSLAINHGANPTDADYSYVMLPGVTKEETAAYAKNNTLKILSNTEALQAVVDAKLGAAGFNFWTNGAVELNALGLTKVTADKPASVTAAVAGKVMNVGISDPTQKNGTTTVRIEGKGLTVVENDKNVTVNADATGITLTVDTKAVMPGATSFVKVTSKALADDVLTKAESMLKQDLTTKDLAEAEAMLAALNELTAEDVSDPAKLEKLTADLNKVIADMKATNGTVDTLDKITHVDDSNVKDVQAALDAYNKLTAEQKALLTDEQKAEAQRIEMLLKEYETSKPDPEKPNPDNKPDPDNKPAVKPVTPPLAQTGDSSNVGMWVFILVLAAAGAAVSFFVIKKRNNR